MNTTFNLFRKFHLNKGWTMLELLIASSLTTVVVGASGYGLLAILHNNKIANATSETQHLLNLGVEVISNEVKSANQVDQTLDIAANSPTFKSLYQSDITSGKVKPVLSLKIDGLAERVVYYLHDKTKETASNKTPWAGPMVLYRFGPLQEDDGSYLNRNDASQWGKANALIDLIDDKIAADRKRCFDPNSRRLPIADANTSSNTDSSDAQIKGFFTCVRNGQDLAEIHSFSKLTPPAAKQPIIYEVSTRAFTRSDSPSIDSPGTADPKMYLNTMVLDGPGNVSGEVVSVSDACKSQEAVLTVDPDKGIIGDEKSGILPAKVYAPQAGTLTTVSLAPGICKVSSFVTPNYQNYNVLKLQNGDSLTKVSSTFANSSDLANLSQILGAKGYLHNGTVLLNSNQVLVLLEEKNSNHVANKLWKETDPNFDDMIAVLTVSGK